MITWSFDFIVTKLFKLLRIPRTLENGLWTREWRDADSVLCVPLLKCRLLRERTFGPYVKEPNNYRSWTSFKEITKWTFWNSTVVLIKGAEPLIEGHPMFELIENLLADFFKLWNNFFLIDKNVKINIVVEQNLWKNFWNTEKNRWKLERFYNKEYEFPLESKEAWPGFDLDKAFFLFDKILDLHFLLDKNQIRDLHYIFNSSPMTDLISFLSS